MMTFYHCYLRQKKAYCSKKLPMSLSMETTKTRIFYVKKTSSWLLYRRTAGLYISSSWVVIPKAQ